MSRKQGEVTWAPSLGLRERESLLCSFLGKETKEELKPSVAKAVMRWFSPSLKAPPASSSHFYPSHLPSPG